MLILSGGHDSPDGAPMKRIAAETQARGGKLIICTTPTSEPAESFEQHAEVLRSLGVRRIEQIDLRIREEARQPENVARLEGASAVFVTGGDQLRLTATIGDSPFYQRMFERYEEGMLVSGTSAGCAAIPETMLVGGSSNGAPEAEDLAMAPGLGFLQGIVLDTHFAERGRIGRLLAVVAQNPKNLGLGVSEDTAIVVEGDSFEVIGSGAVFVVDGASVPFSSLSGESRSGVTSIFGVTLHALADGDRFDIKARRPDLQRATRNARIELAEHTPAK
jgi:cyanophycinase